MAAIDDLINKIEDSELRDRIRVEVNKLSKQKKFGLVFENHVPECTALYDVPIHIGCKVAIKNRQIDQIYIVKSIHGDKAKCLDIKAQKIVGFSVNELVTVAEFGEAVYPYLKPIDKISNAPDKKLWHTLIEADNYHALQLLEYLYAGQVDCIYIDPPYNSGAKDWKYNNDYVDSNDAYRHSKWLSMMEKRLKLAKKLLNPNDSVLICTIDEKEYLHLGCLLEELFPDASISMVSTIINRHGSMRFSEFTRVNEYIFFIRFGKAIIGQKLIKNTKNTSIHWHSLRRSGTSQGNFRSGRPGLFYPIYINNKTKTVELVGKSLALGEDINDITQIEGCSTVLPIREDGREGCWALEPNTTKSYIKKGYFKVGRYQPDKKQTYSLTYLQNGTIKNIESGYIDIDGYEKDGSIIASASKNKIVMETNQWDFTSHDATEYGTNLLTKLIGGKFNYPKSLYAVFDCLSYSCFNKPNALILDFFAGSGTTLHAVNLLNAEDNGNRRCIMVTNNEVSDKEAKQLIKSGFKPGDSEWERLGIARHITWPRTTCSIKGTDVNGEPLDGNYGCNVESYIEIENAEINDLETNRKIRGKVYKKVKKPIYPELANISMSDGFKSNVAFFKLGFLDKNSIALGKQLKELIPVLWMKTGCIGPCPKLNLDANKSILFFPENEFAILVNEFAFSEFESGINNNKKIKQAFIVTDSHSGYKEMISHLNIEKTYQLYRDYLDNFRINIRR